MTSYMIWNRIASEETYITEEEAKEILKPADLYTGFFGGMGQDIDKVLYDEGAEDMEDATVCAIHYNGEWLEIPEEANNFISYELANTSHKDNYNADDFSEMIRDWQADNSPMYDDLEIGDPEMDTDTGKWEAVAYDGNVQLSLTDDGKGNIVINYLGTR